MTGWHTGYPDAQALGGPRHRAVIPWEPDTAAFLLDFVNADGSPFEPSPRQLLQRVGQRARALGFLPRFGSEYELLHLQGDAAVAPREGLPRPDAAHARDVRLLVAAQLANARARARLIDGCNAFDVPVEGMHTETGPGRLRGGHPLRRPRARRGQGGALQDRG